MPCFEAILVRNYAHGYLKSIVFIDVKVTDFVLVTIPYLIIARLAGWSRGVLGHHRVTGVLL
jgi:hypothetical protein